MHALRFALLLSLLLTHTAFPMKIKKHKRKEKRTTFKFRKKKKTETQSTDERVYVKSLPQMLVLQNNTPWELEVFHVYESKPDIFHGSLLVPKDKLILETPKSLSIIAVLVTVNLLTEARLLEIYNLKDVLSSFEDNSQKPHIMVPIAAPQECDSLETLKGFTYNPKNISKEEFIKAFSCEAATLLDEFPTVKYLISKNRVPFAKDYLGLPEPNKLVSDIYSLENAYRRLCNHCNRLKEAPSERAQAVLEVLKVAYATYSSQIDLSTKEAVKDLIKKGCHYSLKSLLTQGSNLPLAKVYSQVKEKLAFYEDISLGQAMLTCLENEFKLITLFIEKDTVITLSETNNGKT